ncbi:TVP38/TMEM64 family protein [Horticoccus luteus]|uniref:TVP38/TMEM64 family protein n=1 Tax=Horticoccus luteus TaxID=2862869 RepID=UPI0021071EA1|nr:hypothetical protein [Horticoccus luteus]
MSRSAPRKGQRRSARRPKQSEQPATGKSPTWRERLRNVTKRQWISAAVVVLALIGIAWLYHHIDIDAVHDRAQRLNGWLVFVLITVLPLLGFPITIAHAVAGVKFGMGLGLALVSVSILLQLLISYGLVHLFRDVFARRLKKVRRQLPKGANGPVTLFTVLLPGVPYFAKNYVIPVMGVPLRTFLLWAFPVHVARSSIAIFFGDKSDDLTPGRITFFVIYAIVITVGCGWAFRRLRSQLQGPQSKEDDPKRGA